MTKRSELIASLLAKLSVDHALQRRFKEDPLAFGAESGLSEKDLALVAGGNQAAIHETLGNEVTADCLVLFVGSDEN